MCIRDSLYATIIIVLVFLPLFALPGMEGRLFVPLGIAFIVSTLASLVVSVTVTPVLSFYLLPHMKSLDHGDTKLLAWLKASYRRGLQAVLNRPKAALAAGAVAVLVAAAAVPFFPTTFLPPFNEGTLLIGIRLNPGVTLAESSALAQQAEVLVRQVPEVVHVGRRSGRAELDEHAEGVHVSELDVGLKPAGELSRSMDEISADIRARLINLPAAIAIGQPISHRIDHMLSGVRSQIAIKIFGDDLDTLRGQADVLRSRLAGIPGLADLEIEKQVLAPQIKVRVDYAAAAQYGVPTPQKMCIRDSLMADHRCAGLLDKGAIVGGGFGWQCVDARSQPRAPHLDAGERRVVVVVLWDHWPASAAGINAPRVALAPISDPFRQEFLKACLLYTSRCV